jgi:hypothetical protein
MSDLFTATNRARRRAEWLRQDRQRLAVERRLQAALVREFRRFSRVAARTWYDVTEWGLAVRKHEQRVYKILRGHVSGMAHDAVRSAEEAPKCWGRPLISRKQGTFLDRFLAIYDNYIIRSAKSIADTTKKIVERVVGLGLEEGEAPTVIARNIRTEVPNLGIARARAIARTETHSAQQAATRSFANEVDEEFPLVKVWVSTEDDRTRPTHAEANGQQQPLDQPFQVGDALLQFPGDPSGPPEEVINCRCVSTYEPA